MITEDYIDFKTSLLLKEKGFNEKCRYVYMPDGTRVAAQNFMEGEPLVDNDDIESVARYNDRIPYIQGEYAFLCPTQQLVMKWLREEKNIHVEVNIVFDRYIRDWFFGYGFYITSLKGPDYEKLAECDYNEYRTYEEACEAAIKYCLENLI